MKRFFLLFLLTFQISFSQQVLIKGIVNNSGTYYNRQIDVIVNDTIQKQIHYNNLTYKKTKEKAKKENRVDNSRLEFDKNSIILQKLWKNKNYFTQTDSLGNFEIKAKLTDSLFFDSYAHVKEKYLVADLIKRKKINLRLKLEPCEPWPSHPEKPTKLYVFIGKKIKAWNSPSGHCNVGALDTRTLAQYEVIKNIYGHFPKDTIQFTSYTHSYPMRQNYTPFKGSFLEYDYCLLYILQYNEELIQIKYLFDDVYLTKEGRWASPLKPNKLFHTILPNMYNQPDKIDFINPIEYTYDEKFEKQIKELFPESYNQIKNGKIRINYGYYVDDLFRIRKTNRLKEYQYLFE